jgi:hypothetical protein
MLGEPSDHNSAIAPKCFYNDPDVGCAVELRIDTRISLRVPGDFHDTGWCRGNMEMNRKFDRFD